MSTETILAIIAILLAVINRPIELLWDKIFTKKNQILNALEAALLFTIKVGIAVFGIVFTHIKVEFGRLYVELMLTFSLLLVFMIITEFYYKCLDRIKPLEVAIKQLQNKEDKALVKANTTETNQPAVPFTQTIKDSDY